MFTPICNIRGINEAAINWFNKKYVYVVGMAL